MIPILDQICVRCENGERVALCVVVSTRGSTPQSKGAKMLVVADGPEPISPCGGCRQRLREFAGPETPVYLCSPDGVRRTVTLGELLPLSFGPSHLD